LAKKKSIAIEADRCDTGCTYIHGTQGEEAQRKKTRGEEGEGHLHSVPHLSDASREFTKKKLLHTCGRTWKGKGGGYYGIIEEQEKIVWKGGIKLYTGQSKINRNLKIDQRFFEKMEKKRTVRQVTSIF